MSGTQAFSLLKSDPKIHRGVTHQKELDLYYLNSLTEAIAAVFPHLTS